MSSNSYPNQFKRVEVVSSRYEKGQLLVTIKGLAGEQFEDLPWREPHGFHSRPHGGTIGYMMTPGGRSDQNYVVGAYDTQRVPEIGAGEAAMYDNSGKVVKLDAQGWHFNMDVEIDGKLTVTGDVEIGGNVDVAGSVVDGDGDGGA